MQHDESVLHKGRTTPSLGPVWVKVIHGGAKAGFLKGGGGGVNLGIKTEKGEWVRGGDPASHFVKNCVFRLC